MDKATEVVLAGLSAGGLGTFLRIASISARWVLDWYNEQQ